MIVATVRDFIQIGVGDKQNASLHFSQSPTPHPNIKTYSSLTFLVQVPVLGRIRKF